MGKKLPLMVLILLSTFISTAQARFILITVLYNEGNSRRRQEYITCMDRNLKYSLIEKVHVIYDTSKDDKNNILLEYLRSKDVEITFIKGRPTYGYCFEIANSLYPDCSVILSNADIYFNHTLQLLKKYDLTDTLLTLTRWNVSRHTLRLERARGRRPNIWSHDAWIFKTPMRSFNNNHIKVGTVYCDCRIAYQAQHAGLHVLNPCLSIQCCHLHQSRVRHHETPVFDKKETVGVPWSTLPGKKK